MVPTSCAAAFTMSIYIRLQNCWMALAIHMPNCWSEDQNFLQLSLSFGETLDQVHLCCKRLQFVRKWQMPNCDSLQIFWLALRLWLHADCLRWGFKTSCIQSSLGSQIHDRLFCSQPRCRSFLSTLPGLDCTTRHWYGLTLILRSATSSRYVANLRTFAVSFCLTLYIFLVLLWFLWHCWWSPNSVTLTFIRKFPWKSQTQTMKVMNANHETGMSWESFRLLIMSRWLP